MGTPQTTEEAVSIGELLTEETPETDLDYKLTPAGRRLNDAMAAVQDARSEGVDDVRVRGALEDELFEALRYFVQYLIRPWLPNNSQLAEEYRQAAYLGAMEALRVWDRKRGAASSAVTLAVRKAVMRQVRHSEYPMMSNHDFALRGKISRLDREAENTDTPISNEEMARVLEMPETAVKRIRGWSAPSSVDRTIGTDGDTTLADMLVGDEDALSFELGRDGERALVLEALARADAELDDVRALYTVIRVLGLDGETPESLPKIRSHLGKTNTETLRLKHNRYVAEMERQMRSLLEEKLGDEFFEAEMPGLDADLTAEEAAVAETFGDRFRAALLAEARLVGGDDLDLTSPEAEILCEVLTMAFRDEEDELIAWHLEEIGDLENRAICQKCASPNSPKRLTTWGCSVCRHTPRAETLFEVTAPYTLATLRQSKAWTRVVARRNGATRTTTPRVSRDDVAESLWRQPTLDGHFA